MHGLFGRVIMHLPKPRLCTNRAMTNEHDHEGFNEFNILWSLLCVLSDSLGGLPGVVVIRGLAPMSSVQERLGADTATCGMLLRDSTLSIVESR